MNSNFEKGYEYGARLSGVEVSAEFSEKYIKEVEHQIGGLEKALNRYSGDSTSVDKLKGKIAEVWHENTYNIDAAVKGVRDRATVLGSREFGSIDISTSWGDNYGLKYHANPYDLMKQQSKSFIEAAKEALSKKSPDNRVSIDDYLKGKSVVLDHLKSKNLSINEITKIFNDPLYDKQFRLVPSDKFDEFIHELKHKIAKEMATRPEQAERYISTLNKSVDRIMGLYATQSTPLTELGSREIAGKAKKGGFNAKDYNISTEDLIKFDDILRESLKAGASAAVVYCALKLAPEIIKLLKQIAKEEGISKENVKELGIKALSASGQGFIRGTIAASLTVTFKAGLAGELAKRIDPFCISMAVTLLYNTINDAIKMSSDKITKQEFAEKTIKQIYVTVFAYCVGYGSASLFAEIPPLSTIVAILGNLIGAIIGGFLYDNMHSVFLSFCAETGYTFFGLVDQDYTLPDYILKDIGLDVCKINICEFVNCEQDTCTIDKCSIDYCDVDRVQKYYISRGIIGINKIGYLIN